MRAELKILNYVTILVIGFTLEAVATQIDYKGYDRIENQEWTLEFTLEQPDSFCVRMPYPDYTMAGRWAAYATKSIDIELSWDVPGTTYYEETHYNPGYSNQGVWIEVFYPSGPITFTYSVTQSVLMNLLGTDYGMDHHTDNSWMCGTDIVDVDAQIVEDVLSEAQVLQGDWHQAGYWAEPEKIVNWLNINMEWVDLNNYELQPRSASYILNPGIRRGSCEDWAHAACALLLRAGIPAKVVLVGATTSYNDTNKWFDEPSQHLCIAYWDGFGWIMIDPKQSSGFAFISRVFLGADRDSKGIRITTFPDELILSAYNASVTCINGTQYGLLQEKNHRCQLYTSWEILEHYSFDDSGILEGSEPLSCIIPNVTSVENNTQLSNRTLFVNYPNPFNPVTTFRFNVVREGRVRLDIYSVDGRHLDTVLDRHMSPGEKEVSWFSDELSSGIYFAHFRSPSGSSTRKVIVLK